MNCVTLWALIATLALGAGIASAQETQVVCPAAMLGMPYCVFMPHTLGPTSGRCFPIIGNDSFENIDTWRVPGRLPSDIRVELSPIAARTGGLGLLLENKPNSSEGVGVDSESSIGRVHGDTYVLNFWYRYQGVPSSSSLAALRLCLQPEGASWDCLGLGIIDNFSISPARAQIRWKQETINVTRWVDQWRSEITSFRLRIDTTASVANETWHVDDVTLWSCPAGVLP